MSKEEHNSYNMSLWPSNTSKEVHTPDTLKRIFLRAIYVVKLGTELNRELTKSNIYFTWLKVQDLLLGIYSSSRRRGESAKLYLYDDVRLELNAPFSMVRMNVFFFILLCFSYVYNYKRDKIANLKLIWALSFLNLLCELDVYNERHSNIQLVVELARTFRKAVWQYISAT